MKLSYTELALVLTEPLWMLLYISPFFLYSFFPILTNFLSPSMVADEVLMSASVKKNLKWELTTSNSWWTSEDIEGSSVAIPDIETSTTMAEPRSLEAVVVESGGP